MRTFPIFFMVFCWIFSAVTVRAEQICKPDSIPASTPDSQFVDNNDGTVTDLKTGLMWKKCLEGVEGDTCESGSPTTFTWQDALKQPGVINNADGFAKHTDWRLPNIRELLSIVEEQCAFPAINLNLFPNTPISVVWSSSPDAYYDYSAWYIDFERGISSNKYRNYIYMVRLVRGGR